MQMILYYYLKAKVGYRTFWIFLKQLQVNVEKSKVLIFNSNGKSCIDEFTYNGNLLQTVSKYCYLGLTLKCNGSFNLATTVLMEKARKAYFKIKKTIGLDKLLEKLFDTIQ